MTPREIMQRCLRDLARDEPLKSALAGEDLGMWADRQIESLDLLGYVIVAKEIVGAVTPGQNLADIRKDVSV